MLYNIGFLIHNIEKLQQYCIAILLKSSYCVALHFSQHFCHYIKSKLCCILSGTKCIAFIISVKHISKDNYLDAIAWAQCAKYLSKYNKLLHYYRSHNNKLQATSPIQSFWVASSRVQIAPSVSNTQNAKHKLIIYLFIYNFFWKFEPLCDLSTLDLRGTYRSIL